MCIYLACLYKRLPEECIFRYFDSMDEQEFTSHALQSLGERIKKLRLEKGYTNAEKFAYEHNISRSQYARYERGADIRFSSLAKIIHAFGMTVEEFFSKN